MVNTIRTRAIILFFAAHLVGGTCLAQQGGAPAGHVEALEGTATIQRQGTLEHIPVGVGDDVYPQDFIQTSRDSKMRILLNDGSVLTIGVEGRLRFNRYSVEANQSGRVILNLLSGALQVVAQWLPLRNFELRTQTAAVGIRGTHLFVDAKNNTTGVLLTEGSVAVRNIDPRIPGEVALAPGEGTDVAANRPPTSPNGWGAARRAALEAAATLP